MPFIRLRNFPPFPTVLRPFFYKEWRLEFFNVFSASTYIIMSIGTKNCNLTSYQKYEILSGKSDKRGTRSIQ